MCRRVTCETCGKPTFVGCGLHVESVLAGVPQADRCQGHASADARPVVPRPPGGPLARLIGAFSSGRDRRRR